MLQEPKQAEYLGGIAVVDTIHLGGLEQGVRLDLGAAQCGGCVSREERVTCSTLARSANDL